MLLKHLLDEDLNKTAIANTPRRRSPIGPSLDQDGTARSRSRERHTAEVRPRATKLDRYQAIIADRLAAYPEFSATRLFAVRAASYAGGITQVREYVARVHPKPEAEPLVRFETSPAHQAQVDFVEFRFPWASATRSSSCSLTHACSGQFYPCQRLATIITGLEAAFAYFGRVRSSCSSTRSRR